MNTIGTSRANVSQNSPLVETKPPRVHIAGSEETLSSIARNYGVPVEDLARLNPQVANSEVVYPGEQIALPTPGEPRDVPGDSRTPDPAGATGNPYDAIAQIEDLPKPNWEGIPRNLPPEDRQAIYDGRVAAYNEQRIAIADAAIAAGIPPQPGDFADLPGPLRKVVYEESLNAYYANLSALREISANAKIENLRLDPDFSSMPQQVREQVVALIEKNQYVPANVDVLVALADAPGFQQLGEDEQARLLNLVGGQNEFLSEQSREAMRQFLADPNIDLISPQAFRDFLEQQPGIPYLVPSQSSGPQVEYTVSGPTAVSNHPFPSGPANAQRYEVTLDGQTIEVFMPASQDPNLSYHNIDEIAAGLASLPPESRTRVDSVNVNPGSNPDDAYWAQQYGIPGFRSYMTAGASGIVDVYPQTGPQGQDGLDSSLIHETGHIISGQEFGTSEWNDWEAAMASDQIDASQYARSSKEEDFAETVRLYLTVRGTPAEAEIRALMPERFAILDGLF